MSDLPPRRPIDPEEQEPEFSRAAYEATVPGRMGGFRGTNPLAFVIAGALAIGIILLAGFAFFHRGSAPPPRVATGRPQDSQPAAPGVGGALQTPFIPEAAATLSPRATPRAQYTLPPFVPVRQQPAQVAQPAPVAPAPPPQQVVPAPAATQVAANDQMAIAQPSGAPNGAASPGTASGPDTTQYVPVYKDGQLVSVVAVSATSAPSAAASASAPPSSQFAGGGTTTGTTGELSGPNGGLLEARKYAEENERSAAGYIRPSTYHRLATSTVINARLMSKIESDLPGQVIAQVTQPVYDSATHTTVVIPAGTRVYGKYDEETVASSTRILLAFTRLIFPDGQEFDIGGQPASDSVGAAGVTGDVDKHRGQLYTTAFLLTVLAGAETALAPQNSSSLLSGPSVSQQIQTAAGAQLEQVAAKLIDAGIGRPNTIIVRPPYAFQIIVTRDLPLDQYAAQHQ